MSKKQQPTYTYPKEIIKEYHQLMNSKENFLEQPNLTRAEVHKLITLYEELESVWNLNSTEKLNNQLEENSIEFRKIQKEIESDCSIYKKDIEIKLRENLNWKKEHLKQKKKDLIERKQNFKKKLETWKEDIIQKEKNLKLYKENINLNANQRLKDLKSTWKNWEQIEPVLKSKLQNLKDKKNNLNSKLEKRQQELWSLQEKNRELSMNLRQEERNSQLKMNDLRENLKNEREASNKKLEILKKELDDNLKNLEEKLLKLLREKIAAENPESTAELKTRFIKGDFLYLSAKEKAVYERSNGLKNYMTRGLTKAGMSLDNFLELMEKYDK